MTDIASFLLTLVAVLRDAVARAATRESIRANAAARQSVAPHPAPETLPHARLMQFWAYALRTAQRLERLVQRWQAGTLPPRQQPATRHARTTSAAPATTQAAPRPAAPRLPRTRGWGTRLGGHSAAGAASQLQHLLTTPEMAAFLGAAPQATRLLRPFWRMLTADPLPAPLAPATPPPPLAPKPPRPPRPALPPLLFQPYVRAAIRALRKKYG